MGVLCRRRRPREERDGRERKREREEGERDERGDRDRKRDRRDENGHAPPTERKPDRVRPCVPGPTAVLPALPV